MLDLYYEITNDGYHIYDRNNSLFHVHQYEPYIPYKNKTYAENAQMHIQDIIVGEYIRQALDEKITIDDVPEEYRETVAYAVKYFKPSDDGTEELDNETIEKAKAYDILMGVSE